MHRSSHGLGARSTFVHSGHETIRRATHSVFLAQIDDFEDGDIAEYTGDLGSFSVQSSTVLEGANTLQGQSTALGSGQSIVSTEGLLTYPQAGDIFRARVQLTDTDDQPAIAYAVQSGSITADRYYVLLDASADALALHKVATTDSSLRSVSAPLSANLNIALDIEVDWQADGTHTVTLYDISGSSDSELASLTASDSQFSEGGIGWEANTAASATATQYFDDFRKV